MVELHPHQKEVLNRLDDGKILWGGVGSGKSIVALEYYMENHLNSDIYIITTAKKRDSLEWEGDAAKFGIGKTKETTVAGVLYIDSWHNISKYVDVKDAFFIFDEQKLVGSGAWVKSFQKIVKNDNAWILLSATPGDTWMDYVPIFVANGYYANSTQFKREHVVYRPFNKFPVIERYIGVSKLERIKKDVLVEMPYFGRALRRHEEVAVDYDEEKFKRVWKDRWNVFEDEPIRDVAQLFAVARKVVYSDPSRLATLRSLMEKHPKLIVFYNFNYELQILRELYDVWSDFITVAEWNGHKKDPIPNSENWVYLVQYTAGAEGWNCIETNAMVFYSLTYSYKQYEQAQGRIDRLNTPFTDLYYYIFVAKSAIDRAVKESLKRKKSFNERKWSYENLPI